MQRKGTGSKDSDATYCSEEEVRSVLSPCFHKLDCTCFVLFFLNKKKYSQFKFYRQWIAPKPVSSQDESGYELPVHKEENSKRFVCIPPKDVAEASVSKPPPPRFVPL